MLWVSKRRPQRYLLTCRRFSLASCAAVLPEQESCRSYSACVSRLQQCIRSQALRDGQRIHDWILGSSLRGDPFLGNLVIQMYATCGNVAGSWWVFGEGIHRRNVFSWNTMMGAFLSSYQVDEAMILFKKMPQRDVVSWNTILAANAQLGDLDFLQTIFGQMPQRGVISWNTMITSFAQSKDTSRAIEAFAKMPKHTVVSWTAALTAFAENGHFDNACVLFDYMPERNDVSWSAMAAAYAEHLLPDRAIEVVSARMPQWSITSLSSLIQALLQSHRPDQAWIVFAQMNERNEFAWNIMLQGLLFHDFPAGELVLDKMPCWDVIACNTSIVAYAQNRHIAKSRAIFFAMPHCSVASWNAILDAFVQINSVEEASRIFCLMPCQDAVSWTAILAVYAQNGHVTKAQGLFQRMPAGRSIFAWNSLLHAWSQAKFPHTVAAIFHRMPGQDLVSWNTLLAAYVRSGFARESLQILCRMDLEAVGIDEITFISVLDSISAASTNCDSRFLLDEFLGNPEAYSLVQSSCVVANALVAACAKSGYLADAWTVFCNQSPGHHLLELHALGLCVKRPRAPILEAFPMHATVGPGSRRDHRRDSALRLLARRPLRIWSGVLPLREPGL
ncbi:pentatricopeptide repeat-containing protein At4g02750-like [Selaginella moellendorffii]|uniref:pentatricopeptide repeat-containing protein At4g02750-like n=1 Tax=Selaginella moellendorffii TaxID=88036 RepID=UPI000D1C4D87|nr:pentatricopeptide repeat-containing protein At4g02750-like [Selaginella moellendorffii]|eukprot:XP_024534496.1 pentatricopeptide repeat-containing protein At4g02750-like [Selaginella moellendorffii]